ncbi:MAG: carboxylesterase family protein [Lachnospiraceae bacterium]|nr:carboxylesterase family protein [Robinsoniella sp.]MDY3767852.1 carboxylesterase family protein [Lachnospiraceae bacterium]
MKNWKRIAAVSAAVVISAMSTATVFAEEYNSFNPPIATTAQGELMGFMNEGTYTFLGIPYASAERFEAPQKVEAWDGVKSAQAYGTICPIQNQTSVGSDEFVWPHRYWVQNENCMNLNVWTQSLDTSAKRPVIVFFHGGGYRNGSSIESAAYDGRNLSEYGDVVVVTVNHRLNVLGYMDLSSFGEEYADSVNIGTQDMVASLEWIQENIENFGGDPDNVTIFGQSGGGGKVNTLLRTPSAEGLFDKAACISGSYGTIDKETNDAIVQATLKNLGLDETQVDELKTLDYYTLINAAQAACTEVGTNWTPEADGVVVQADLCDWANDIPFIASTVFSEFNYSWTFDGPNKNLWTEEETMANLTAKYGDKAEAIAEEFQKVFPDRPLADAYFYYAAGRIISRQGVETILEDKLENATAPVYEYLFDYEIPVNGGILSFHCCDLIYIFHNVDVPVVSIATGGDETAHKVQDQVADAFLAFMETGNPSTEELEWKPYTTDEKNIMVFSADSECKVLGDEQLYTLIAEALQ